MSPRLLSLTIALLMFPQLAQTLYSPALADLAQRFTLPASAASQAMSLYLLGFALGVLLWGRLADRVGRRPALLGGLSVFVLAALGGLAAGTFGQVLAAQMLAALGAAAASVVTQTVLRDHLEGPALAQAFSWIGMALALSPAIGLALGSLLVAADELAVLRARSPEHARELADWTGRTVPVFGIDETEEERRYRQAACLLADISWRAHPDYRGLQALNVIAHSSFVSITHPGRAFIALANYYRFEGLNDNGTTQSLADMAGPRLLELAKLLGGLLRVVYLFSASMPGVVDHLRFRVSENPDLDLEFVVPHEYCDFAGERLEGRLQQLAKLTGKRLAFIFE